MKFFHKASAFLSLFFLSACLFGSQAPAPAVYYGTTQGEGSAGVHNVVEDDTLWSVAQRYKILMPDIIAHNHLQEPFRLSVGQRLRLPPPQEYRVRSRDTLYAVSRIFGVSLNDMARINNLSAPYALHRGQVLKLPSVVSQPKTQSVDRFEMEAAPAGDTAQVAEVQGESLDDYSTGAVTAQGQAVPVEQEVASVASPAPRAQIPSQTPARSSSKFMQPASGRIISGYGPKAGGLHNDGINIAAPRGTLVAAAENGVVVYVGDELKGSGNLVLVRHADRWMSAYAHLDSMSVARGQTITRGQTIGTVGSTGSVSEPQLHFELRRGTQAINPEKYI
jgi:murein DD-endopeptidase MepM/ murein hydrolase activator NlpD